MQINNPGNSVSITFKFDEPEYKPDLVQRSDTDLVEHPKSLKQQAEQEKLQACLEKFQRLNIASNPVLRVKDSLKEPARFEYLPREITSCILNYAVSNMKSYQYLLRVNKLWHRVITGKDFVKNMFLQPIANLGLTPSKTVEFLKKYGKEVSDLALDFRPPSFLNMPWMPSGDWEHLGPLIYYRDDVNHETLADLLTVCQMGLTHVNLCGCRITRDGLRVLQQFPNLKECQLYYTFIDIDILAKLPSCTFNLYDCHIWQDSKESRLQFAIQGNVNLKTFRTCRSNLTDGDLKIIGDTCPNLEVVYLTEERLLTEEALIAFLCKIPRLRQIDLRHTIYISDRLVEAIAEKLKSNLIQLVVNGARITDRSCYSLAQHCPNLKSLDLGSSAITDDGVAELVASCRELRSLCFANTAITNRSLNSIAACCKELRVLILARTTELTDSGFIEISEDCPMLQLLFVGTHNQGVTDNIQKFFPDGIVWFSS